MRAEPKKCYTDTNGQKQWWDKKNRWSKIIRGVVRITREKQQTKHCFLHHDAHRLRRWAWLKYIVLTVTLERSLFCFVCLVYYFVPKNRLPFFPLLKAWVPTSPMQCTLVLRYVGISQNRRGKYFNKRNKSSYPQEHFADIQYYSTRHWNLYKVFRFNFLFRRDVLLKFSD